MIILSSFNADYLRNPLQFLIDQFMEDEKVVVNYGNIITSLLELEKNGENKVITILFRLIDLVSHTEGVIEQPQLQENLRLVIDTINTVRNRLAARFIVILCPSLEYGLPNLQPLEESFYEAMQEKAISLVKVTDIQSYYSLSSIENEVGKETHIPYTPIFYTALSGSIARKLHNLISKPYKVIVVDCDDTLWQGVVGDLGAENVSFMQHHRLLQTFLMEKNKAGILICLCSKNDQQNVIDVFEKRSNDMPLMLENVSKFKINWQLKSENISQLAQDLNLGLDSFVFIDDSPFELEEVRRNLPEVLCIQAPQNEEEFFALKDNWAFDFNFTTIEDTNRSKLYKEDEKRQDYQSTFSNYIQFLQSINLSILIDEVKENQEETIKRISILSAKTNQFNLFPLPKDIAEVKNSLKDNKVVFNIRASDNFGDYGLIAVAFCHIQDKSLLVDSFFVSCRAFKKGIEYHFIKHIAQYAVDRSLDKIDLCFKKTEKNKVAQSFINLLLQKFNIPCEYTYQTELDKETSISFSSAQLALLDVNSLLEIQNGTHDGEMTPHSVVKKHGAGDFFNKNDYLTKLQRLTKSLDFLLDKFFFDERKLLNLPAIESKVFTLCHFLLGDIQDNIALIYLGLDSLKATELSYYLFKIAGIDIPITVLLNRTTTLQTLISYIEQQRYSDDPGFGADQEDSLEDICYKMDSLKLGIKHENDSGISSTEHSIEKLDSLKPIVKQREDIEYKLNGLVSSKLGQAMPTSFQQKRIWLAEKKEINQDSPSSNYIMVACFSVSNLQIPRFQQACKRLIKRHDAFGCSFFMRDKELLHTILPAKDRQLFFEVIPDQDELTVEAAISEKAKESFLMSEEPLIRFSIFVSAEDRKFYILMRAHHGIFDAISLQNTVSELSVLYQEERSATGLSRIEKYQYSDFISYQNRRYNVEKYQANATEHWSNILSSLKLTTEFPYDKAANFLNLTSEHPCKRHNFSIPQKDFLRLKQLAQSTETTVFNLLSSMFSILVSAYSYEDKVAIITATNGRNSPAFHKVVGFFVNLIILPFDLEKNISFFDYVKENGQVFLDSLDYQELAFEKIQEITQKQGIANILVNPALIYQSYKPAELVLDGEQAVLEIPKKPILYDLRETCRFGAFSLFLQEESTEINGLIEYSESLYSDAFIQRISNNFIYLINNICQNPYQKLHDISCVSKKEQAELLSFSKGPIHHYNEDLASVFKQRAFNYPDAIAITHNEMTLTYRELDDLSTRLANHLAKEGVGAYEPVGLYFEKAYLFFIAELALLKLGAVFVPLFKADPVERLNFIIQNAKIKHVVSDVNFSIKPELQAQLIKISKQALEEMAVQEEARPLVSASLDSRVCILYTSGSTGVPKGVSLKQKGIIRVVKSANYIQVDHHDKVAQAANLAFDAAQLECWLAWTNGAALVIVDKDVLLDSKLFEEKLLTENVTVLWLTAALFHQYAYTKPTVFSHLKYLLAGGDAVEKKAMQEVFSCSNNDSLNLIIGYGPTEASIFATTCRVTADIFNDFSSIPIGRPVNNTEIRLLDRFKKLAPLGAKAHLAIGGDSLTEGYLANSELQKERFVIYPELLPSTLYLSGDQVRLTRIDNPQLLFCGRMDGEQLKRAGVLVSLPEIEAALMSHPAVKQAALLTKDLGSGKKQLIAFYIRHKDRLILDNKIFSDYLSSKLPPFMFPDFYQELDQFPTTANGKLDKKALLSYKLSFAKRSDPAVLTDSQRKIANLFRDVLSLSSMTEYEIDLDESFFNYGGTSILAVQLIYEIEQLFSIRLSFNLLRQNSSIRAIDQILNLQTPCPKVEQDSSLILLQKGEEALAPIGFIHPAGGALYCYEDLMKKTMLNNAFFGIEDPVLSRGIQQNLSLEEMAKSYLLQIEDKFKQPFILSGYSFGGMLALEMAAQLEERNVSNLLGVILLDTWVVSCASEPIKCQLKQEVLNYYSHVRDKIGESRKHLMDQLEHRYRYLQDLGFAFKPKKLKNTPVILLKATLLGSSFEHMAGESKNNYLLDFVNNNKFHRAPIQGTHYSILEEEYVDSTAKVFYEQVMKLQKNEFDVVNTDKKEPLSFFTSQNSASNVSNSTDGSYTCRL